VSTDALQVDYERLVFALIQVCGSTAACRDHGDVETVAVLAEYYALVAEAVGACGGQIVKVLGDGVLVTFPVDRAKEAVDGLRGCQSAGSALWSEFDSRCRVQVKAGAGRIAAGYFGPPGAEWFDVYGTALNELFRAPSVDFMVTGELGDLLGARVPDHPS